jgi:hypothetical protein
MEMQKEAEDKDTSKVMSTSTGTVTYVSIRFIETGERKQKDVYIYRTEHKAYI